MLKQLNIKVMDNKETLEEAAERYVEEYKWEEERDPWFDFMEGAKWQQEQDKNKYSEEDMKVFGQFLINNLGKFEFKTIDEVFEQFKK